MDTWQRRIAYSIGTATMVVLVYAVGYQWAMAVFEQRTVTYVQAVQVVVESITTAGFGGHAPWSSDVMNFFVLAMNLTGVLFVFLAVPVFVVPLFREVLKAHPPTAIERSGHIIVCHHTPRGDAFIAELSSRGRDYVLIEPDQATATALHDAGYNVMVGNPESTQTLKKACLSTADGVVADAADDVNASIALSVRELNSSVRVVTLVEDPALADYHRLAGADVVLSPRQLLGASLARQVPAVTKTAVDEGVEIGKHIELVELKIEPGSMLCHQPIEETQLRERFGVDIIGVWEEGRFTSPIARGFELKAGVRLLVAGHPERMQALQQKAAATIRHVSRRNVIIAGYGRAGEAAAKMLTGTSTRVVVLDREAKAPVDVVGDVRDPSVLEEAEIGAAAAAIVTLDDDTTAIFATLIMRELNPDLYIIVRANREEDEQKLYRAGANYVQSLATVSGRMMASTLFEDEEVLAFDAQVEIVKLPVGRLAGHTLAEAAVRTETGVTVLAAMRHDDTLTELDPHSFRFEEGDDVVLAGPSERIRRFEARFLKGED